MSYRDLIHSQVLQIREDVQAFFLQDTAQLLRKTGNVIERGQSTPQYDTPIDINCRVIIKSGSESEKLASQERSARQLTYTDLLKLQVEFDLEINVGDIIVLVDIETNDQKRYDVITVPPRHNMMGAFIVQLQMRN
jgi:hypothetical protein